MKESNIFLVSIFLMLLFDIPAYWILGWLIENQITATLIGIIITLTFNLSIIKLVRYLFERGD